MIALRVADSYLDIDDNTRLRLQLNNPLISRTVVSGEYSFPFRLPATAKNIQLLDYGSYLETGPDYPAAKTAWLYIDGLLLGKGVLNINYQGQPYIDTSLKINTSIIAQYKDKLLSELDWGPDINLSSSVQVVVWEVASATSLSLLIMDKFFGIPMAGSINATLNNMAALVNGTTYNNGYVVSAVVSGNRITFTASWTGMYPYLFTHWSTSPGTTINAISNPDPLINRNAELSAHMDAVNALSYPEVSHVFFPVLNRIPMGTWMPSGLPIEHFYQNYYDTVNQQWIPEFWKEETAGSQWFRQIGGVTPFLYVASVLDNIFRSSSQFVSGFFHDNFSEMKTVVWSNRLLGEYSTLSPTPFNLRHFLPQVTVAEFLQVLCDTFCLGIISKNRGLGISVISLQDILTSPADDWSSKVNLDFKIYSETQLSGVKFDYDRDDADEISSQAADAIEPYVFIGIYPNVAAMPQIPGPMDSGVSIYAYALDQSKYFIRQMVQTNPEVWHWKEFNSRWAPLIYGDENNSIDIQAADPIDMLRLNDPYMREDWVVPQVKQPFASAYVKSPQKVRFLNYMGMQPNRQNHAYPLGSSDNLNYDNVVISDHSLRHDQPTGFFNKYWKKWVDFLSTTRKVELQVNLTTLDLLTLDFSKRIHINGNYYLIYDLKVELPLTKPTLVTLLRIR